MADLESLMQPVAGDDVAGPDLTYDARRQEIEGAFETARLAESGETAPPDWRAVIRSIKELSEQSKDAWLAVYLARAGAWAQDLAEVELGCAYLAGMFDEWWDVIHPSLAEYGFEGRKGACESLVGYGDFLRPLRRVTLVAHPRLGQFTAEQLEQFASQGETSENIGSFRAAVAETEPAEISRSVELLQAIRGSIGRIDAILTSKGEGDTGTNFTPAYEALNSILAALISLTGVASTSPASEEPSDAMLEGANAASNAGPLSINSRTDVVRAMELIIRYYSQHEPGSPIPLVIGRAKGWVEMDFLSILRDINPGGAGDAERVLTRSEIDQ